VDVDVDEPGSNNASGGVDDRGIGQTKSVEIKCGSDCSDCPVGSNCNIGDSFTGAVNDKTAGDDPSC
jgi:hypothetical protein